MKQSDIPHLLLEVDKYLTATNKLRGTSQQLVKAAPLEIHLYNLATNMKRELEIFKALLEDTQGTYLR